MKIVRQFFSFLLLHKWFTIFVTILFLLNVYLLVKFRPEVEERSTCSSYDTGYWGTFALYKTLEKEGVSVSRTQNMVFFSLEPDEDSGKTLLLLNPISTISSYEWKRILEWIENGNRLISCDYYGPYGVKSSLRHSEFEMEEDSLLVTWGDGTSYSLPASKMLSLRNRYYTRLDTSSGRSVYLDDILYYQKNSGSLISSGKKDIAIRRIIGKGEWIAMGSHNPFGNEILRSKPKWFRFAQDLLLGDPKFSDEIIFDEYHQGYRVTKSLSQLLSFYEFDDGLKILAALILLYLFFTGIRILPPLTEVSPNSVDTLSGQRTIGNFFFRYGGWRDLLYQEMELVSKALIPDKSLSELKGENILERLEHRHQLPHNIESRESLVNDIDIIISHNMNKKSGVRLFKTVLELRKVCDL